MLEDHLNKLAEQLRQAMESAFATGVPVQLEILIDASCPSEQAVRGDKEGLPRQFCEAQDGALPFYEVEDRRRTVIGETAFPLSVRSGRLVPMMHAHAHQLLLPIGTALKAILPGHGDIIRIEQLRVLRPIQSELELHVSLDPISERRVRGREKTCYGELAVSSGERVYFCGFRNRQSFSEKYQSNTLGENSIIESEEANIVNSTMEVGFRCPPGSERQIVSASSGLYASEIMSFMNSGTLVFHDIAQRDKNRDEQGGPGLLFEVKNLDLPSREDFLRGGKVIVSRVGGDEPSRHGFTKITYEVGLVSQEGAKIGGGIWKVVHPPSFEAYEQYMNAQNLHR